MTRRAANVLLNATLLLSAVGAVAGFWRALSLDAAPGRSASAVAQWPADCPLPRAPGTATLIMSVHPECPCSRASLGELAQLVTHCQGKVRVYVLFVQRKEPQPDRLGGELWNLAELTGVTRLVDEQNLNVRVFGARTSGQVLLYDGGGRLRFSGGITSSRGHAGDNDGRAAIEAFLLGGTLPAQQTPVYGCALN